MTVPLPQLLRERIPVFAAPMAGGPSTPALVSAAATAGHFGQLAGGYRTVEGLAEQIAAVRAETDLFGVNLFVPNAAAIDEDAFARYRERLRPTAERLGILDLPGLVIDDDFWDEKIELLLAVPVPAVSFTFGLPPASVVQSLRTHGTITIQTITASDEARAAQDLGIDVLVVQSADAGGHSGVIDPLGTPSNLALTELISEIRTATTLPLIGAGGIANAASVRAAIRAGASAVAVGTALLRAPESGASPVHKTALVDPQYDQTVLTRAFTGRFARALVNRFVQEHGADAPAGYPALHHLTKPIRTAGVAASDASAVHLWAGTGWRHTMDRPVAETLATLSVEL